LAKKDDEMPIYSKSVRSLMGEDMIASFALNPGQTFTRLQVLDWFAANYPKIKKSTITAHLSTLSANAASRVHHNARPEDDRFFQIDSAHFRLYDPSKDPAPIYKAGDETPQSHFAEIEPDTRSSSDEFAYETDLRNYLAKNLSIIEPKLKLFADPEEGITGIEFPVGGRFIDILAVSTENEYVVIELKVSRGYDRVVGQLLRYMAWISKYQATPGQKVRGVIVAREISEDLLLACSWIPHVRLFEYQMSLALKSVSL